MKERKYGDRTIQLERPKRRKLARVYDLAIEIVPGRKVQKVLPGTYQLELIIACATKITRDKEVWEGTNIEDGLEIFDDEEMAQIFLDAEDMIHPTKAEKKT